MGYTVLMDLKSIAIIVIDVHAVLSLASRLLTQPHVVLDSFLTIWYNKICQGSLTRPATDLESAT